MTAFLLYIFKVIVCSALFAACYWLTLRNERPYQWNRFCIVASVALSIVIPLLNIPLSASYMVVPAVTGYVAGFVTASSETAALPVQTEPFSVFWGWFAWAFYASIVLFLLAKEVKAFVRILRLKRRSERIRTSEAVLYCTDDASAPFTFFRTIFWKKGMCVDSDESRCILRHELAHARLGHSWDKALMQLVCCLFWMNPFFMLFRRELELVHEFAADSENAGEELSSLILCTLYPNNYHDFTSRFFQSNIKRRIFMMTKNKKKSMNMLRKMSIIPVALVAMYLFAINSLKAYPAWIPIYDEEEFIRTETVSDNSAGSDDPISFAIVHVKPLFNGKNPDESFTEYINGIVVYPVEAAESGIQGRVFAEFIIELDGSLSNVILSRSADPLLNNEVLRVLSAVPKNWTPGKLQDGTLVRVKYAFPFTFRIDNNN